MISSEVPLQTGLSQLSANRASEDVDRNSVRDQDLAKEDNPAARKKRYLHTEGGKRSYIYVGFKRCLRTVYKKWLLTSETHTKDRKTLVNLFLMDYRPEEIEIDANDITIGLHLLGKF